MKSCRCFLLALLAVGGLLAPAPAQATIGPRALTENPIEAPRKAAAQTKMVEAKKAAATTAKRSGRFRARKVSARLQRTLLVMLGLKESKAITSPAKLTRRLHAHQQQLKAKARSNARARRARARH